LTGNNIDAENLSFYAQFDGLLLPMAALKIDACVKRNEIESQTSELIYTANRYLVNLSRRF